jgi:hypothetical protein
MCPDVKVLVPDVKVQVTECGSTGPWMSHFVSGIAINVTPNCNFII